jgi:hypothetical protein
MIINILFIFDECPTTIGYNCYKSDHYMELFDYLKQTGLFLFGDSNLNNLNYPYLVFLISTSLIGLLCVLLDFAYYNVTNGKSIFLLSYIGKMGTILMFLFWGIGAGIVGFLAVRLGLIAFTIQASIIMGLGWPLMFPRLYALASGNINNIEPEEEGPVEH